MEWAKQKKKWPTEYIMLWQADCQDDGIFPFKLTYVAINKSAHAVLPGADTDLWFKLCQIVYL